MFTIQEIISKNNLSYMLGGYDHQIVSGPTGQPVASGYRSYRVVLTKDTGYNGIQTSGYTLLVDSKGMLVSLGSYQQAAADVLVPFNPSSQGTVSPSPPPPPTPNPNNTPPAPPPTPVPSPPPATPSSFDGYGPTGQTETRRQTGLVTDAQGASGHLGANSDASKRVIDPSKIFTTSQVQIETGPQEAIFHNGETQIPRKEFSVPGNISSVNDFFKSTAMGSMDTAISQAFGGFNRFSGPPPIPHSKDVPGYTFIVRPQLNLQSTNIRNVRSLYSLFNEGSATLPNYNMNKAIRCILDPRFQRGYNPFNSSSESEIMKALAEDYAGFMDRNVIDPYSPFIAILSNTLKSVSGWPDITVQTFTSKPGLYNEMYTQVDSHSNYYEVYDIDLTFKNIIGDPVTYLFYVWIKYASLVFEGLLLPYMDYIKENTIDYTTRIYRLVMDSQRRRVSKIMATGYCYPIGIPTGSFFDFDESLLYSDQNKDISIRFRCSGAIYNDEILIRTFNESSAIFNPIIREYMKSNYKQLHSDYTIVDNSMGANANYLGNPIINPHTRVLEWICHRNIVTMARNTWFNTRVPVIKFA